MNADTTLRARKKPADRMAPTRYLSLPVPLDARVTEAAERLRVSRTLLLREAVARGLKAATDTLRREQRRHSGTNGGTTAMISDWGALVGAGGAVATILAVVMPVMLRQGRRNEAPH